MIYCFNIYVKLSFKEWERLDENVIEDLKFL